ncbi:hypothetical protein [Paenibacillus nasutitermitis]|uniref:Uncharacterized protein n=1 Tax=Paenibacillus nasutitermitis TaxID=1652958 RepID=A0A917E077_9BACL|nr:hypothetical protein [Paenibacillus nasutitermitis]GGD83654.1 hypothetical protein GCM10010911_47310 [Paenibacillus nasutitermitis]
MARVEHVGPEPFKGLKFAQDYFRFILKKSIEQDNYELFGLHWLVNSLFLAPSELFISQKVIFLLADGSAEGKNC